MKPAKEWADELLNRFVLPVKGADFRMEDWVKEVQADVINDEFIHKQNNYVVWVYICAAVFCLGIAVGYAL